MMKIQRFNTFDLNESTSFKKIEYNSHFDHNPDCDITIGYLGDAYICYGIYVKDSGSKKKGDEFMEYYRGSNYDVNSTKRSHSRHFTADNIPAKYKGAWLKLKQEYNDKFKNLKSSVKDYKLLKESFDSNYDKDKIPNEPYIGLVIKTQDNFWFLIDNVWDGKRFDGLYEDGERVRGLSWDKDVKLPIGDMKYDFVGIGKQRHTYEVKKFIKQYLTITQTADDLNKSAKPDFKLSPEEEKSIEDLYKKYDDLLTRAVAISLKAGEDKTPHVQAKIKKDFKKKLDAFHTGKGGSNEIKESFDWKKYDGTDLYGPGISGMINTFLAEFCKILDGVMPLKNDAPVFGRIICAKRKEALEAFHDLFNDIFEDVVKNADKKVCGLEGFLDESLHENKEIELTFLKVDDGTGNLIYKGDDNNNYVDVEGVIHTMTDAGEPDYPIKNVKVKDGEPVYDPKDRFARKLDRFARKLK